MLKNKLGSLASFAAFLLAIACVLTPSPSDAFWLLGFSPAPTLAPGKLGFISGTGGQITEVGDPVKTSFTPSLAHAGIRLGLLNRLDIGYRLCTVPLPFSSVGPTLGSAVDAKVRLTSAEDRWQAAAVVGGAYAYLSVSGQSRNAWSPGVDFILSREVSKKWTAFGELRYVDTEITSAPQGESANHVQVFGPAIGAKIAWTSQVALAPEIGVFDFQGRLAGKSTNGFGLQYGVVLAVSGLPGLW